MLLVASGQRRPVDTHARLTYSWACGRRGVRQTTSAAGACYLLMRSEVAGERLGEDAVAAGTPIF